MCGYCTQRVSKISPETSIFHIMHNMVYMVCQKTCYKKTSTQKKGYSKPLRAKIRKKQLENGKENFIINKPNTERKKAVYFFSSKRIKEVIQ